MIKEKKTQKIALQLESKRKILQFQSSPSYSSIFFALLLECVDTHLKYIEIV